MLQRIAVIVVAVACLGTGEDGYCGAGEQPPETPYLSGSLRMYRCCDSGVSQVEVQISAGVDARIDFNDEVVRDVVEMTGYWVATLDTCGEGADSATTIVTVTEADTAGVEHTLDLTAADILDMETCSCGNGVVESTEQCEDVLDCDGVASCGDRCECEFEPWSETLASHCESDPSRCYDDALGDYIVLPEWELTDGAQLVEVDIVGFGAAKPDSAIARNLMIQLELPRPYSWTGRRSIPFDRQSYVLFVEFADRLATSNREGVTRVQGKLVLTTRTDLPIASIGPEDGLVFDLHGRVEGGVRDDIFPSVRQGNFVAIIVEIADIEALGPGVEMGWVHQSEWTRENGAQFFAADVTGNGLDDAYVPLFPSQ